MAATDMVKDMAGSMVPSIGGGSAMKLFPYIAIILVIAVVLYFVIRRSKFDKYMDMPIVTLSERQGKPKILFDKGGFVPDKKNKHFWNYWIKSTKKPAPNPPYESLYASEKGNVALFYQKSPTEMFPAIIEISSPVEYIDVPQIDRNGDFILDNSGKQVMQKVAKLKLSVIEPDIQLWQANMDDIVDREFQDRDKTKQLIPMIIWGIFVFGTIIGLYILAKKFDVLADVARQLAETASILKQSGVQIASNAPS